MAKAKARTTQPNERLSAQLALASMAIEIRSDVVLTRLVARLVAGLIVVVTVLLSRTKSLLI